MNTEPAITLRIKDFTPLKHLGSGGMGIVYLARQDSLDRLVALKILGPMIQDLRAIAGMQREAKAVALLDHPNIPPVYHAAQDDKVFFIASRYIEGASLRRVIDRLAVSDDAGMTPDSVVDAEPGEQTPFAGIRFDTDDGGAEDVADGAAVDGEAASITPEARRMIASEGHIRRCCEIVRDVALALDYAHQRGVVHRDIKPSNLMLGREGTAYLIDFGVARYRDDFTLSPTWGVVGTPGYISPEGLTGRLKVDHRSDIFSLGVVLYELLTLRHPFGRRTSAARNHAIASQSLPPISRRNPAISGRFRGLEAVVHKATSRTPAERYQTAGEFGQELQRVLDARPVASPAYRYRFDVSEIAATRPFGVTVAANILFFYVGLFFLTITGFALNPWLVGGLWVFRFYTAAAMAMICVVYAVLARGVLHARPAAMMVTLAVSGLSVVCFLWLLIFGLASRLLDVWTTELFILVVLSNLYIIRSLLCKPGRGWFWAASALRAERLRR